MKRKIRRIKRNLKKYKIALISISILIITLIIVLCIIINNLVKDKKEFENILIESTNINKNLSPDNYNNNYIKEISQQKLSKTKNNTILENAIEEFSKDYSETIDKSIKSIKDEKYTNLLTATNYQSDGPSFNNSLNYINEKTKEIESIKKDLNSIINKTYYTKYIKEKTTNPKIIKRYNTIIKNIINKNDINTINNDFASLNEILKVSNDILIFLGRNNTTWHIENNEIIFTNQEIKTEYENSVNKIKR